MLDYERGIRGLVDGQPFVVRRFAPGQQIVLVAEPLIQGGRAAGIVGDLAEVAESALHLLRPPTRRVHKKRGSLWASWATLRRRHGALE